MAFVYKCSAPVRLYKEWQPEFAKIMSTIEFKKMYNEHITGEYREDFLTNPHSVVVGVPKGYSTSVY